MKKSYLMLKVVKGKVYYRHSLAGKHKVLPRKDRNGNDVDTNDPDEIDQDDHRVPWEVLVNDSICEFHDVKTVELNGWALNKKSLRLCVRAESGDFKKIKVHSIPIKRKAGNETELPKRLKRRDIRLQSPTELRFLAKKTGGQVMEKTTIIVDSVKPPNL